MEVQIHISDVLFCMLHYCKRIKQYIHLFWVKLSNFA